MGLDMYLYADRYLSEYGSEEDKNLLKEVENVIGEKMPGKIRYVTSEAIYWRKMNAIHRWFVKNVQHDIDDCRKYYVPIETLVVLRNLLKEILHNKDLAAELLPTQIGFFFGSDDYDEWYFSEVERTEKELGEIVDNWSDDFDISYYYQSSW